jgi:hypothetical protein
MATTIEHTCWRCGSRGGDRARFYIDDLGRRFLCPACAAYYQDAGHRVSRYPPKRGGA